MTAVRPEEVPSSWEDQDRKRYIVFTFGGITEAKCFNIPSLKQRIETLLEVNHRMSFSNAVEDLFHINQVLNPHDLDVWSMNEDVQVRHRVVYFMAWSQYWIADFEKKIRTVFPTAHRALVDSQWRPFDNHPLIKPLLPRLADRLSAIGEDSRWFQVPDSVSTFLLQKRQEVLAEYRRLQEETTGRVPGVGPGMRVETHKDMQGCPMEWWGFKIDAVFLLLSIKKTLAEYEDPEDASTQAQTASDISQPASDVEQVEDQNA
uniref:Uncharacterized protein n=1 Tax=Chromera velia CCMP2878 TaxID=1169474 RepID=A0A0K6S8E5_9ALVE|eukprot:Cvel_25453.t2-p1 / transcript=Cvel_25453.t2 / gene=Cvel_25453 / organism=Chromera_velia_CCMP2878 / gene_product=hypothetical protein / transcript_product=hypothetical protein / location=Cvel_scaffold2886:19396-20175(-) / protein_length=260 / sequence_SO=supercontig / SO=protein_coding / is_pseudo=false